MRAGELLRRLDSRVLPPLARGMARLGQGQVRPRVLTVAATVSVTAVLMTAVWAADRGPVGDQTVGDVVRVGVVDGDSIPGYVRASRDKLDALSAAPPSAPTETYALVTFAAYLAPGRLSPVLDGLAVSEVFSRVPLPHTQTQIVRIPAQRVPDDVTAGMAQVAQRKEIEARDYRERGAALTGDGDQERELRQLYDSGARVALAEATAYRSHCSCVYAAVVRATPALLRRVAERPEVRAVDPAPELRRLERAVFLPPLPEQQDVVRPPADGDLATAPTATPGPVGTSPAATSTVGVIAPSPSPVASDEPTRTGPAVSPSPTRVRPSATDTTPAAESVTAESPAAS
ncbi:hypothetical protein SAMN05444365_105214 [Micromonospora pattaloongensis]|uniref:Uncharacterized protein n=1 Tax=Micromonospora pattaloongensis TaxID=405436 RepID=A0A1H3Q5D8_9ACTN|nr:hypothetical protein [Micromonospora pattaloongensis]SDZ07929.1 hypothetical protein SAMN05444365_105214 [Micromonospora pattaloongensis]